MQSLIFCFDKSLNRPLNLTEMAAHSAATGKIDRDLPGDKFLPSDFSPFSNHKQKKLKTQRNKRQGKRKLYIALFKPLTHTQVKSFITKSR